MLSASLVLSIIDSTLKLGVLYIESLPDAARATAAAQIAADVTWWREKLHLPTGAAS